MSLLIKLSFSNNMYPVHIRFTISSSVKSVLSATISPMMLWKLPSALLFCLILITVIHLSLGDPKIWYVNFKKFKIMLPASSVILPGLTTYLQSFMIYTGFLLNLAFSTKYLFSISEQPRSKLQTHKRFKRTLFIRTEHSLQIFRVIPFIKLQNDT